MEENQILDKTVVSTGLHDNTYEITCEKSRCLQYCTYGLRDEAKTPVVYKSLEEAFKAYQGAGAYDGKTLGFTIDGQHFTDLTWFDSKARENCLYRCDSVRERFKDVLLPNELKELEEKVNLIKPILQKQNACLQIGTMLESVVEKAAVDIQKGKLEERWMGRVVNERNPGDYFEIQLECDDQKEMLEMKLWTVKDGKAIDLQERAMYVNDLKSDWKMAFMESYWSVSKHIEEPIAKGYFNLDMPYGQNAFSLYASHGPEKLEKHYEMLEEMNDISEDIRKAGFHPSEKLVSNIKQFLQMEGKNYTLKELAELNRSKPDFSDSPEKKECFEAIVQECQEQELQKVSFFKQEMLIEQLQIPVG